MRSLRTLSLTAAVNDWLAHTCQPRVLHIFDHACNLINERREVLSIVTPQIGNGPFHVVIDEHICFLDYLNLESSIYTRADQLALGNITIDLAHAKRWNPRPGWESLHAQRDEIANQRSTVAVPDHELQLLQALTSDLWIAFAEANVSSAKRVTSRLAGLGAGLTPSGDDVLMGAIYAAWILHPLDVASLLARETARTAMPRTTSLSAAWLWAAANGEAGILWHIFFDALVSGDPLRIQKTRKDILAIGETSGADAMSGFTGVWRTWSEMAKAFHE